jgi:hypothetical protein
VDRLTRQRYVGDRFHLRPSWRHIHMWPSQIVKSDMMRLSTIRVAPRDNGKWLEIGLYQLANTCNERGHMPFRSSSSGQRLDAMEKILVAMNCGESSGCAVSGCMMMACANAAQTSSL